MKLDFINFDIPESKKVEVMSILCESSDPIATQHMSLKLEGTSEEIAKEIIETKNKLLQYIKDNL